MGIQSASEEHCLQSWAYSLLKHDQTNLLLFPEPFPGDKVVDFNVGDPDVSNVQSQFVDALCLAGIPSQELIFPLEIEPQKRFIEG